jgi:hypothetical protein
VGILITMMTGGAFVPIVAATSGAGAALGWKTGDLLFHRDAKGLRAAENMGAVQQNKPLDANNNEDFDTETSYKELKKMLTGYAYDFRDLGKDSRNCEQLLPKDEDWRGYLRELSRTVVLDNRL